MSRGRRLKSNNSNFNWKQFFSKNVGKYLEYIFIQLGKNINGQKETGADLLKKIKEEKAKIKKEKELPPLKKEELSYEIPKNWVWCRLGEMSINCDGARIPISQSEREQKEKIYDYYGASGVIDKIDGYTHNGKYLLIGEDGANLVAKSTPIAFIAEGKFWVNNHAHVLSFIDDITMNFMVYCLNSININPFITGGFQPKLSQGNLNMIPIPLPPLSEQSQIVSFLTDFENENLKEDSHYFNREVEQKVIELHEAQLKGIEISTELTHQLTLVKKLRQQLLQDAVQGKLVPQNPSDEPACELLKKIKAEKQKLIAEGKLKKDKELPVIKAEEIPFEIPEGWIWCKLGEICNYGSSPKAEPKDLNNETWVLDLEDIEKETSNLLCKIRFSERNSLSTKSVFKKGYILYSKLRPYLDKVIVADEDGVCTTEILPLKLYCNLNPFYIRFTLKRIDFLKYVNSVTKGMKMPRLGTNEGQLALIPLPPLSEQHLIVQKLDELMKTCDALEASIKESAAQNEKLLQQVLREALRKE